MTIDIMRDTSYMPRDAVGGTEFVCAENRFAGFDTPTRYGLIEIGELAHLHDSVCKEYSVQKPYFEFTDKGEPLSFECIIDEKQNFILKCGPIGSFTTAEMMIFLQEQARNYLHRDTMGTGFPRGNVDSEKELLAMFMDGFKPDDVLVMVQAKTDQGIAMIGGTRIVRGEGSTPLLDTALVGTSENSSISTFGALQLKENLACDLCLVKPENDTVCLTRYWKQSPDMMNSLGFINSQRLARHIIAAIPLAYTKDAQTRGSVPSQAIFDTHNSSIMNTMADVFGARVVADNGHVQTTKNVMDTILRYHYGSKENYGGYGGDISIGVVDTNTFVERAKDHFRKHTKVNVDEI